MKIRSLSTVFFAVFSFFFASLSIVNSHELRPAIADLSVVGDNSFKISISLNLEAFIAEVSPDHEDTDEAPSAKKYNDLRKFSPSRLRSAFTPKEKEFLKTLTVKDNGTTLAIALENIFVPPVGDIELPRRSNVILTGKLTRRTDALILKWSKSFGPVAVRVRGVSSAMESRGSILQSAYLKNGEQSPPLRLSSTITSTSWQIFRQYIVVGFEHILPMGLDHILFVIGLFLLSPRLRPLAWQVSSFTVAHTVTLALGMLGIITISPTIVEPLIAASIVYVGVENIITKNLNRWRTIIVFLFGLLHGLGFAGVLTDFGLEKGHFAAGLIAFNIGVELGQLAVIAICFLLVGIWLRNKPWYRTIISVPASICISVVGIFWFFERV